MAPWRWCDLPKGYPEISLGSTTGAQVRADIRVSQRLERIKREPKNAGCFAPQPTSTSSSFEKAPRMRRRQLAITIRERHPVDANLPRGWIGHATEQID
jgi:hypothetical protein